MQLLKLTVLSSLFFALAISFTSCEKDSEKDRVINYVKSGIVLSGAQEVPATTSAAQGSLDVSYSKASKTLTYKFTWSGLTDTIFGIYIYGLAPSGYATSNRVQTILGSKNEALFPFRGGSYSGSLYVDGVKVKEEDILNHFYYLNIHTKTYPPNPPTNNPQGEIRGQIRFQ